MRAHKKFLLVLGAALAVGALACENRASPKKETGEPSPNASILPAPLAASSELIAPPGSATPPKPGRVGIPADSAGRLIIPDAGTPPPTALAAEEALARDTITTKDGIGATLEGRWSWSDIPSPPADAKVNTDGIDKAREKTRLDAVVDLGAIGRMRFEFSSIAYPLPKFTEVRSRIDRLGHVLVWPNSQAYKILVPGALRALLAERRTDATPLVRGKVVNAGNGQALGLQTVKKEVRTSTGKLVLEQAEVATVGSGGPLFCRFLLELVAVQPTSDLCKRGVVPIRATYSWTDGGKLGFEVSTITRRLDIPFGMLFTPPAGAKFERSKLPPEATGVMLTREELDAFRTEAVPRPEPAKEAPGEGLYAVNRTSELMFLLLDGVPIAWVRPREQQYVIGPKPGRYSAVWRDFLGSNVQPNAVVHLPDRIVVGEEEDGGG